MSASSGSDGSRENHVWSPLLTVLTCVYAILFGFVFRRFAYGEPGGFPVFYTAGKLARYDLRGLYNQHLQNVFHPLNDGVGYFFHLPYETILLVPLSYLPQTLAFALWSLAQPRVPSRCGHDSPAPLQQLFLAHALRLRADDFPVVERSGPRNSGAFDGARVRSLRPGEGPSGWRNPGAGSVQVSAHRTAGGDPCLSLLARALGFIRLLFRSCLPRHLSSGRQGIHDYVALTHGTDAKEAPGILINLRGIIGVLFGPHHAVVIVLSIALMALAASIKGKRIPMFCVALIVTQLVSWHAHLYDALILLIPMAWMYESKSRWIRYTHDRADSDDRPCSLIRPMDIFSRCSCSIALSVILIPRSSRMMLAGT